MSEKDGNEFLISIGAGVLDIDFMKGNDPNKYHCYQSIKKTIDSFRKTSRTADKCNRKESIVKKVQPNNTISILGDRGVGKTSLLLTVIKELEESNNNGDVFIPIIDPGRFKAEKDALGWVIFYFEKLMPKKCEEYCKQKEKQLNDKFEGLKEAYVKSREYSLTQLSGLVGGQGEFISKYKEIIFSDMELSTKVE